MNQSPLDSASPKILIVEDNEINVKVLAAFLKKRGYSFEIALSGKAALEKCQEFHFSVVLMDCQMPIMDGFETAKKILEMYSDSIQARPSIIAVTANAMVGDRERCLASGMDDYLPKPVEFSVLEALLKKYLAKTDAVNLGDSEALSGLAFAQLQKLQETDPSLIRDILELFLTSAPASLKMMRESLETGALDEIRGQAHKLKSSAATVGAIRLSSLLVEIEKGSNILARDELAKLIDKAEKQFRIVLPELVLRFDAENKIYLARASGKK